MKQQVFFKIKNLRISKMTDIYATEGNRNVFEAVFDFETKDWDGLAKTAVFENTQGVKEKQLLNEDKCDIPNIFFATSGVGYVSVFAGDFMVTNKIPIIIVNAGYNISDPNPEAANYFEQILKYFDATNLNAKKYGDMARRYAVGDGAFPESLKDNAEYYCGKTSEDAKKTGEDRKEVERLVESVNSIDEQVKTVESYKNQAKESADNAALSEQAAKTAETNAGLAKEAAETAASKTAEDKTVVSEAKTEVLKAKESVSADRTAVESAKTVVEQFKNDIPVAVTNGVNAVGSAKVDALGAVSTAKEAALQALGSAKEAAETAIQEEGTTQTGSVTKEGVKQVESITDEGTKQTSAVTKEGEKQVQAVQAVSEGIAQETTAREILEKCSNTIPYLEEIARNSSKAGSLNGFVLEKGTSDSVVLSYTDPETGEFGGAAVLPRETTLLRVDESLKGIVASLKIIALQKGAEV